MLWLWLILGLNPGMTNIESLLNNTVAPNVSLQRSTSVVSDAQLSPGFTQPMMQPQQQNSNQRTPFSPQPNQGMDILLVEKKGSKMDIH